MLHVALLITTLIYKQWDKHVHYFLWIQFVCEY